jgi:hypothetical protein
LHIEAQSAAESAEAWSLIRRLLKHWRPRLSMMILKAFPLEYEGTVTPRNEAAFNRRRAAMMRLIGKVWR